MATVISGFICPKKDLFHVRNQIQANIISSPFIELGMDKTLDKTNFLFYLRAVEISPQRYFVSLVCEAHASDFDLPNLQYCFQNTKLQEINYHSGAESSKKMELLATKIDAKIKAKEFILLQVFSSNIWNDLLRAARLEERRKLQEKQPITISCRVHKNGTIESIPPKEV